MGFAGQHFQLASWRLIDNQVNELSLLPRGSLST